MITELLRPEKIVTGLSGGLAQALEQLFTRSSFPDRVNEYRTALIGGNSKLYTYVDDEIAVPHVRIEGLPGTDMILGLARKRVRFNGHSIKILFFLATAAEQTEEHSRHTVRTAALLSVFIYPAFEDLFFRAGAVARLSFRLSWRGAPVDLRGGQKLLSPPRLPTGVFGIAK